MKKAILKAFSLMLVAVCLTACSNNNGKNDKEVTTTVATVTNEPEEVVTTTISSSSEEISTTTEHTLSTSDVDSESTTTTPKVTTTKKPTTVTTTTTKKKATTTTTAKKSTPTTTTTPKPTTTTTTTSADNSNDLPDGYMHKFTQEEIDSLAEYTKQYAISRGVTWNEAKTRDNSSWSGDYAFYEYNLFWDYEIALEKCEEMVDYHVEGWGTNGQQKFTTLGLEVVVEYDEYRNYPKYWQFYILT